GLMDPNQLERFRREARAAARLHHTNIVPVFGVGEHQSIHYYAMQFIEGQPLDSVLRDIKCLRGQAGDVTSYPAPGSENSDIARSVLTGRWRAVEPEVGETPAELRTRLPEPACTREPSTAPPLSSSAEGSQAYFRNVARIALQAAEALSHAHAQGILHR